MSVLSLSIELLISSRALDEINSSIESDNTDIDSNDSEQTNYRLSIEQLKTNLLNQTAQKQTDLQTTLKAYLSIR